MDEKTEEETRKRFLEKERRKRKRMKVSGKSVFTLAKTQHERAAKKILKIRRSK